MAVSENGDTVTYQNDLGQPKEAVGVVVLNSIGGAVESVNGQTGAVVLSAADVGGATADQGALADSAVQPGDLGALATLDQVGSAQIADFSITNSKINGTAAIALSKLANVAAGTDGLAAGSIQATFQALATRIQALETP